MTKNSETIKRIKMGSSIFKSELIVSMAILSNVKDILISW